MVVNKLLLQTKEESSIIAKIMMRYFDQLSLNRNKLLNQSVSIQIKGGRGS